MLKPTPINRVLFVHRIMPVLLVLMGVFSLLLSGLQQIPTATAATANTVNFQARLQTAGGAIVPDGDYNVEFKLYDAATSGTNLWTETRTSGNKVQVKNGYLTVNLGSVTAFSGINWDQKLWLTMNIGGTGTASWDGEMNPRLPLTAVPYAFSAGQLQTTSGSNTSTLSVQAPTNGSQVFQIQDQGAGGTYNLCIQNSASCGFAAASGSSSYIQNQNVSPQTADFNITGTATVGTKLLSPALDAATSGVLTLGGANATSISLQDDTVLAAGKSITITGSGTRPSSPTEGMMYYDTTTKQLLVYANGKWQADRSDAVLVAASDSSAADKAAADYLADGNTATAADGDQVQINSALTAASGKKVVLLAGTYTVDASIAIPNNTTLVGVGAGTLITIPNSNGAIKVIVNSDTSTGTGVTVRDLRVDGNRANNVNSQQYGVQFDHVGDTGTPRPGGVIQNVYANNFTAVGIGLILSDNNTISDNVTYNNEYNIDIEGSWPNYSYNNSVIGNTTIGGRHGIYLAYAYDTAVTGNATTGATNEGIYLSTSPRSTVSGNSANANTASGIYVYASNDSIVSGNTISANGVTGLRMEWSDGNSVNTNRLVDNGGATTNEAIYLYSSDDTQISGNKITDSSATTTNYSINIDDSGSDNTYISDNVLGAGSIRNTGTGTIYGGQINSSGNYVIQPAGSIDLMKNTNIANALTLGTSSSTNGTIVFKNSTNTNTVTIQSGVQTGSYTLTIPVLTANDTICTVGLANCGSGGGSYVNLQGSTPGTPQTGSLNISGTAIVGTQLYSPALDAAASGALTLGGTNATSISLQDDTVLAAGKGLTITGSGSRPTGSEGMLYYDTTAKQLLVYANGKWQADRSDALLVAASDSSSADKDAADYVADGDNVAGAGTIDGDQIQINNALSAARGKKVVLLAGTYIADATILIPNNTTLAGVGQGAEIQLADIDTTDNLIENSDTTNSATGVTIRDLTINGRKDLNTAGNQVGISLRSSGSGSAFAVQNMLIKNFLSTGIYISNIDNVIVQASSFINNDAAGILVGFADNTVIEGNRLENSVNGIYLSNQVINSSITGNVTRSNNVSGIYIDSSSNNNTVNGNSSALDDVGISVRGSSAKNVITGNKIDQATNYGINVTTNNNTISNNNISDSGGTTTNNGLKFNAADSNTATGNTITDSSATTDNYAINVSNSSSDKNYLSNNTLGTGTINDLGTGTIWAGQVDGGGNLVNSNQGGFTVGTTSANATMTVQGGLKTGQLTAPTIASVTNAGTTGSTTYRYQVTAYDGNGETLPSTLVQTTSGNATLTTGNYNTVTWAQISGAYQYKIYRCSGSSCTPALLATVAGNVTSYNDQANGSPSGVLPVANTTGGASFAGGIQGSSSLSLGTSSTTNGTIVFKNSTNTNAVTVVSGAQTGNYTLTIPVLTANDTICTVGLANCGGGAGGANTSLSNLASVAINTSLISDTTNTDDLGSSSITWRSAYFGTAVYAPAFRPLSDGTTALRIQNAGGTESLLTANTTNNRIKIGNDTASSGSDVTLLVLDNATSGNVPTGLAGAMYYDSTNNKFKCYTTSWVDCDTTGGSGGSSSKRITFTPEYAGGVLKADGSSNNGTMTSDFINGLTSGEGYKHNYYEWTSSQASTQDYDIFVNHQLPSDFNATTEFDASTWKIWTYSDNLSNTSITMTVYDADGTACANGVSIEHASLTGWQQITLTDFDTVGSCDFTANDTITVKISVGAQNSAKVRIGEFQYNYTN